MEDLFPREYWKEATQPTRLHTPEFPFPFQLKRLEKDRGSRKGWSKPVDGTIREIAMAFSFDTPELDLEAESPAPRSEPAAESRRKPPQSK